MNKTNLTKDQQSLYDHIKSVRTRGSAEQFNASEFWFSRHYPELPREEYIQVVDLLHDEGVIELNYGAYSEDGQWCEVTPEGLKSISENGMFIHEVYGDEVECSPEDVIRNIVFNLSDDEKLLSQLASARNGLEAAERNLAEKREALEAALLKVEAEDIKDTDKLKELGWDL